MRGFRRHPVEQKLGHFQAGVEAKQQLVQRCHGGEPVDQVNADAPSGIDGDAATHELDVRPGRRLRRSLGIDPLHPLHAGVCRIDHDGPDSRSGKSRQGSNASQAAAKARTVAARMRHRSEHDERRSQQQHREPLHEQGTVREDRQHVGPRGQVRLEAHERRGQVEGCLPRRPEVQSEQRQPGKRHDQPVADGHGQQHYHRSPERQGRYRVQDQEARERHRFQGIAAPPVERLRHGADPLDQAHDEGDGQPEYEDQPGQAASEQADRANGPRVEHFGHAFPLVPCTNVECEEHHSHDQHGRHCHADGGYQNPRSEGAEGGRESGQRVHDRVLQIGQDPEQHG